MECPNCKHCLDTSSPPPPIEGPKAPCVICFVPVAVKVAHKSKIFVRLTQEDKDHDNIFQWFLLNFWTHFNKKSRKGKIRGQVKKELERYDQLGQYQSVGWDGEGGKSPPLPFCEECKKELIRLMESKKKIQTMRKGRKEEEDNLKSGITEIRRKMGKCEEEFVNSRIYEEDKRYHRVRKYIINIKSATIGKSGYLKRKSEPEGKVKKELVSPKKKMRRTVLEVPCIICCETLNIFPDEKRTMARKDEDSRVFRWFLRNFQSPPGQLLFGGQVQTKILKGEVLTEEEMKMWDGQGGRSEPLQFCGNCKCGILEWMGMRQNVDLKMKRAREMRKMKRRMKECEDKFKKCGIYRKDSRYFHVRRKVVKVLETDHVFSQEKPEPEPPQQKKKGKKKNKEVVTLNANAMNKMEMDKILAQGFGKRVPLEQQVDIVMETEEEGDEEMDIDWGWEDDEEPTIGQVKREMDLEEEDMGMNLFGPAMKIEIEDYGIYKVEKETDPLGPELDLDDKQVDKHRNCLLCYKAISKEESALAPVLTNDLNEQNFNSVFILRKMLNVPKERLVGYLEDYGCPGKWVEYCEDCLCIVNEALGIQKEISELEDKLRKCQEKMVLKIKKIKKQSSQKFPDKITRITEETRKFVKFSKGKTPSNYPDFGSSYVDNGFEQNDRTREKRPVSPTPPPPISLGANQHATYPDIRFDNGKYKF